MMGTRNSISKLIPGNELGSVLRETAREARRPQRFVETDPAASQTDVTSLQNQVALLQQTVATLQGQVPLGHGIVRTNASGVATWTFPNPNPHPAPMVPVVQGTCLETVQIFVVFTSVTRTNCQFKTFESTSGSAWPNTRVFLSAFPSNLVP